jgi:hypothetical protein
MQGMPQGCQFGNKGMFGVEGDTALADELSTTINAPVACLC